MRELSFKGYLERQLCELSDCQSKSLYKFARLAEHNARLADVLRLYLVYYVDDKLKSRLLGKYDYLSDGCEKLAGIPPEQLPQAESEYKTIYENYLNQKDAVQNDNKIKLMMQKRIIEVQTEKGISNYRIYKSLDLNPGNINAFLKNGDVSKVGLNTARKILAFVNQ